MVHFERFSFTNGLRVIVHQDTSTPMAVVNVMYDVGAKDEDPKEQVLPILFEHLMFGGSINIPDLRRAAANGRRRKQCLHHQRSYQLLYSACRPKTWKRLSGWKATVCCRLLLPKTVLKCSAKWLCEEFKEHYLNKPYGDVWLKLRELAYQVASLSLDDHWQRIIAY